MSKDNYVPPQGRASAGSGTPNAAPTGSVVDVAVIGAGPYGLSIAAHLKAAGIDHRIFGRLMSTWRDHMPAGMLLKSEGFASSLSAPEAGATLAQYCADNRLPYADTESAVRLSVFTNYALWFQKRFVPDVEDKIVVGLARDGNFFAVELDTGERLRARHVIVAAGIAWFAHKPDEFAALPRTLASHSWDCNDAVTDTARDITVVGSGASAIDAAASLSEAGKNVRILARKSAIRFNSPYRPPTLWNRVRRPSSGIGSGWKSFAYANAPGLFRHLPAHTRLEIIRTHLGPAPGWHMKDRVEGRIPYVLGSRIAAAREQGGRAHIDVVDRDGASRTIQTDHVVLATGYRTDLRRLPFLADALQNEIAQYEHHPVLSAGFRSSVSNLYFVGTAAAHSYGPLLRFMVGAEYAAPTITQTLRHALRH